MLSIEVNASLDCLVLQSTAKLDVEDMDKNISITCKSAPVLEDGNAMIATCRIMEDHVNRVQLRVMTDMKYTNS